MLKNEDTLLMSNSIKGMIPDFDENQIKTFEDAFIIGTLEISIGSVIELLTGSLTGFSLENSSIKLDIRVKSSEVFNLFKHLDNLVCRSIYLHLGDDEIHLEGPYKISSTKMLDFDHKTKSCILGVDLLKE